MAPGARASDSLTEFSQRERKAIVLLTLAFIVFSALAHFLLGGWLTPWFGQRHVSSDQQTPQPIVIEQFPIATPVPTPTPTPVRVLPRVAPRTAVSPAAVTPVHRPVTVAPPRTGPDGTGHPSGWHDVGPTPNASPVDIPVATPTPAAAQFAPCRMLRKVVPRYPELEKGEGVEGTVAIVVEIGPDGQVLSAHVGESSGNGALDEAALEAARASTYSCPPDPQRPASDLYQVIYTFEVPQ